MSGAMEVFHTMDLCVDHPMRRSNPPAANPPGPFATRRIAIRPLDTCSFPFPFVLTLDDGSAVRSAGPTDLGVPGLPVRFLSADDGLSTLGDLAQAFPRADLQSSSATHSFLCDYFFFCFVPSSGS